MNVLAFKRQPSEDLIALADELEGMANEIREGRIIGLAFAAVPTVGAGVIKSFYADDKAWAMLGAVNSLGHDIHSALVDDDE